MPRSPHSPKAISDVPSFRRMGETLVTQSFRRRPESRKINCVDSGLRRNDEGRINQRFPRPWISAVLMLASLVVSAGGWSKSPENTASTTQYLLNYVADSGLIFIRNSQRHNAADAAKHMNDKYQYYREKIKTPEDFIRLCASKSLITGKPYRVVMENGDEVRTDGWLLQALASYRNRSAVNPD